MGNSSKKKARAARAQQKKTKQYAIWGILAVILIGGIWWLAQGESTLDPIALGDPNEGIFEDDQIKGNPDARVTFIEYGDFQCPACAAIAPVIKEALERYPNDIRVVYRHFPLTSIHPHAQSAAQAAEAAGKQGKFWEMHDLLFERQREWSGESTGLNPINFYSQYAEELGLDLDQFGEDFNSREVRNKVARDARDASERNLRGTPSFLLNGEQIQTPASVEQFSQLIEAALLSLPAPELDQVSVHEHADIALFINGEQFDFSDDRFQSPAGAYMHEYMHFHDNIGTVIHKHRTGYSIGDFFESIGVTLSDACLEIDDEGRYCNTNTRSLKFFVNGQERSSLTNYEFEDLDQILISYGPDDEDVSSQLEAVTDEACIYSELCPERGTPPTEACVGGAGSDCEAGDSHGNKEEDVHEQS